jgi:beta-glucanase (GH16 family)
MLPILPIALLGLLLATPAGATTKAQWISFNRAGAPSSNLQCFTPNNVTVAGGNLVITTKVETATCSSFDLRPATYNYTSGFVAMRSFSFLYGTLKVRAKLGGGIATGAWPVIWMADVSCQPSDPSGTDNDCNEQEIDVAEILGSDFRHVNQQIHVDRFKHNDGCGATTSDTSQNFHVYELDWAPGSLVYKVDGTATCTIKQPYVPDSPMYLKINTFVGTYGGPMKKGSLPWETKVDYVSVGQGSKEIFRDDFNDSSTIEPAEFVVANPPTARNSSVTFIEGSFLNPPRWFVFSSLGVVTIAICTALYRLKARREGTSSR